jgi:methylated-DNA-[protein]-cysteine S-methyltransferase
VRVIVATRALRAYHSVLMGGSATRKVSRPQDGPTQILSLSIPTPIGRLWLAASPVGLVRVELPGPNAELRMNVWLALHFPAAAKRSGVTPILKKAATQLEAYFTAGLSELSVPIDPVGTRFQIEVWRAVAEIPFGETQSYRQIAAAIHRPRAVRAVGSAQSANPLPIVVPCHRVIAADGRLAGYAGGLETKRWLLQHEAARDARVRAPRPLVDAPRADARRRPARKHDRPGTFRPQL